MTHEKIIVWIIENREKCGISQATLANQIGMKQSVIAKIESGTRKLRIDEFFRICDSLNISEDLFTSFISGLYQSCKKDSIWEK